MFANTPKAAATELIHPNISGHLSNPSFGSIKCVGICNLPNHVPRINALLGVSRKSWFQFADKQRNLLLRPQKSGRIVLAGQFSDPEGVCIVSNSRVVGTVKFDRDAICRSVSAIDDGCCYGDHSWIALGWIGDEGNTFKINECAIGSPGRLVRFIQNAKLPEQNYSGYDGNNDQASRPKPNYFRPCGYFAGGIACVMFGCAFASYAAPYSSGEKYQTSQYIIDSPIRFGLVILAFLIVAQGACLIFLAATNCHSKRSSLNRLL